MMEDIIKYTKGYYIDKLNEEINHVDNFIKATNTIKKEMLKNYKILEEESKIHEFSFIIKEDIRQILINNPKEELKEEHFQSINDVRGEYIQTLIEYIIHEQIKKELLKTIKNIEDMDLSTTITFLDTFKDLIIKENSKNIDKPIKNIVSDLITKDLKL